VTVTAIICPNCKDTIFSRARHDFHNCSCGDVGVDGGRDYFRFAFNKQIPERVEIEIPQTDKQLYDDWNKGRDKFGIIKKNEP